VNNQEDTEPTKARLREEFARLREEERGLSWVQARSIRERRLALKKEWEAQVREDATNEKYARRRILAFPLWKHDWRGEALEAFAAHCAKAFPIVHPDSLFAESFKSPFVAGYLAAKSEQESAVRAAKCTGWSEGYERAMNDRDTAGWQDAEETPNPYFDHTEKSEWPNQKNP